MPSRSSRNNNARKHSAAPNTNSSNDNDNDQNQPRQPQPSIQPPTVLPFSPPTQLPTPLPEDHARVSPVLELLTFAPGAGAGGGDNGALSRLIDFDTPMIPTETLFVEDDTPYSMSSSFASEGIQDDDVMYRSPPYGEARLPDDSPPPLPMLPRYQQQKNVYVEEGDVPGLGASGRTRAPTFVRSISGVSPITSPVPVNTHVRYPSTTSKPTSPSSSASSTFDSLSRTIRGYVPAASPAAAAPRVSRPVVGHGVFSGAPNRNIETGRAQDVYMDRRGAGERLHQEFERDYERAGAGVEEEGGYYGYGYGHGHTYGGYPTSPPPPHPAALESAWQPQNQYQQGGYQHQHQPSAQQYEHERGRLQDYQAQGQYGYEYQQQQQQQHGGHQYQPRQQQQQQPRRQQHQQGHQRQHSASERIMGSGLAQAIRRGAAAGASVVGGVRGQMAAVAVGGTGAGGQGAKREKRVEEKVSWARWDVVNGRRVLIVAYPAALQIWDCADLGALREIVALDLAAPEWSLMLGSTGVGAEDQRVRVVHAAVLPCNGTSEKDTLREARPLLGMLLESADKDEREHDHEPQSFFVVYSLRAHQVAKMRPMPGRAVTFVANENFIIIGTTTPPSIHIISSTTFHTLHIIPAAHLEPYSQPPVHTNINVSTSALSALSITNKITNTAQATSVSLGLGVDTANTHNAGHTGYSNANTHPDAGGGSGTVSHHEGPARDSPRPVFALSGRLLAYASFVAVAPSLLASVSADSTANNSSRRLSSSSSASAGTPSSLSSSSSPFGRGLGLGAMGMGRLSGMTQAADVGQAAARVGEGAMRVGESVLGGMKFLGGMALEAARSRVGAPVGGVATGGGAAPEGRLGAYARSGSSLSGSPVNARFVSRSAPDENSALSMGENLRDRRRYSGVSALSTWDPRVPAPASVSAGSSPNSGAPHLATVAPATRPTTESGHFITVLDLGALLRGGGHEGVLGRSGSAAPIKIAEFNASRSQPVADVQFAGDGTGVGVVLRDGHAVRLFRLQPMPRALRDARAMANEGERDMVGHARHAYDLYRGRTSAVVEGVDWARDGRWVAVGTRNRTVHVFAVNPYGGRPDVRTHLEGRVRNGDVLEPDVVKVHPLVRLRGTKGTVDQHVSPLAFTFIEPADVASSPNLAFPFAPPPVTNSPTFSAPKLKRGTNYQDLLVFDPVDGILSLRRLTIGKQAVKDQGIAASMHALGVTSISLPGMGGAGRLSSSPSTKAPESAKVKVDDPPMELVARVSVEATWDLRRGGRDHVEIKTPILPAQAVDRQRGGAHGVDWLAEGEISTCSKSTSVLPRSLYLSHQFTFYTLGEDYHALIRRYQFDISGAKIEVRKLVEISTYTYSGGESSFVEGFSSPRDIRRISSPFDEPIASAISGSFDNSNLPVILPMYPNGIPGSNPKSFRNSIPIRTMAGIGDGVSDGLGRIRRGVHKAARSPQLAPRSDGGLSGPVPLEFDEEDEDFVNRDALVFDHGDSSTSRDTSRDGLGGESMTSLVTPLDLSTHHLMNADVVGSMEEDLMDGWDPQDKLAVEEAEQFHDFAAEFAVGDEGALGALPAVLPTPPAAATKAGKKGRAKRR